MNKWQQELWDKKKKYLIKHWLRYNRKQLMERLKLGRPKLQKMINEARAEVGLPDKRYNEENKPKN